MTKYPQLAKILALFLAATVAVAQDCVWNAPNGKTYDLTPLKRVGGSYNGYESATFSYAVNFCTAAISSKCASTTSFQSIEISSSGACTGIAQSTVSPTFTFKNGTDDTDGIVARFVSTTTPTKAFTFELRCSSQEYPTEPLTVVYQSTGYVASNVLTKYACSTGSAQSPSSSLSLSNVPAPTCSWAAPDGMFWDFSRLARIGDYYNSVEQGTSYRYFVNVCTDAVTPTCPQSGFVGFEYLSRCRTLAKTSNPSFRYRNGGNPRDGILMEYKTGGQACSPDPILTFLFVCGSDIIAPEPLQMAYEFRSDTCQYTVTYPTSLACPYKQLE
eukprot:TRINITY_DN14556_c0_g1_i1.p1 TRINITY_DN14556_c0_g1~~TRINITY_DN14556_c0_g1_i1.p1  ORF type:complete len:329 (-),score=42.15 TRINITY_DN14556_c0_g1_i1:140-1126(-)